MSANRSREKPIPGPFFAASRLRVRQSPASLPHGYGLAIGPSFPQPQRGGTRQPRATPWVRRTMESPALKGRDNGCAALSGLDREGTHTQGVALGWRVPRRWR